MRRSLLLAGSTLLAVTAFAGDGTVHRSSQRIPGRYVVVLESGASLDAVTTSVRGIKNARIRHTYGRGFKGLAIEMSDADAHQLSRDSRVKSVEEDSVITATTVWGLDRIDQRLLPLDGGFVSKETGAGVTAYVVDTGIMAGHYDLGGRVAAGFSALEGGSGDCNGHGTHVAGVIGGSTYGVAKSATLVPVRVLDCDGSGKLSTLLAGLDWIFQQTARPAVVNMSLGGRPSSALDEQVNRLLAAGMTTIVAAGNDNKEACSTSPARVPGALTVGSTNESDQRSSFSNYGACIDIFAPGSNIVSAWYTSATATATTSGTSSAAPFVAGVAALWLEANPNASASAVTNAILSQATLNVVTLAGKDSPNRLLSSSVVGSLAAAAEDDDELLHDPGFDFGDTFWSSDICTVVNPTGCPPDGVELFSARSGGSKAAFGGPALSFYLKSETVTIPATVRSAQLSFYLWVVSKNRKQAADVLSVEIRDQNGALLETLKTFTNLDTCPTYAERQFDVTRYRGKTIRISFTGAQGKGAPTWFLVDDVSLSVMR